MQCLHFAYAQSAWDGAGERRLVFPAHSQKVLQRSPDLQHPANTRVQYRRSPAPSTVRITVLSALSNNDFAQQGTYSQTEAHGCFCGGGNN